MKHTLGPWVTTSINGWDAVKPEGGNLAICRLVENNPYNAVFIAAAPDMLAALQAWNKFIDQQPLSVRFSAHKAGITGMTDKVLLKIGEWNEI